MPEQDLRIPEPLNTSKIPSLDGLRAISIFIVVISHLFYGSAINISGAAGVEIFFVISGFLITTLLLKEKTFTNKINLKSFYIRRAFRILPLVFLFLFVLFILNRIFQLNISNRSFLATALFLKNLPISGTDDWYNGHFWSLSIEEQFYIIFPFLIAFLSLRNYKRLIVTLIILLPTLYYCYYNEVGVFYSNRIIHVITGVIVTVFSMGTVSILVGSFLSVLMFDSPRFLNRLINLNSFLLSLFVFVAALVIRFPDFNLYVLAFSNVLFAFLIGLVIIMNMNTASIMAKWLNLKFMTQIGVLSYSLYVWQQLFTRSQPWKNTFPYAGSRLLNVLGLLLVAFLSYWFYEKKFLDYKNRFKIVK
jgi:peptidoglycan/LPS O-acetylase OafA/YrhL